MRAYDVAGMNRLRFVFDNKVMSLGLAADATFEDVAQALSEVRQSAGRGLISIDVTLAQRGSEFGNPLVSLDQRRHPIAAAA